MNLKKLISGVTALALCISLAACTGAGSASQPKFSDPVAEATATPEAPAEEATPETSGTALRVAGLKGPTTMGLCNLINDTKDTLR